MYCPECGLEYRQGVTVCPDCGVALVTDRPAVPPDPKPEWVDLETVLETSDPALLTVARSLLEAEGIPSFAQGEVLQEFLGWGRLPSGSNLITGPVRLQVPRERAAEARALLKAVGPPVEASTDEPAEG